MSMTHTPGEGGPGRLWWLRTLGSRCRALSAEWILDGEPVCKPTPVAWGRSAVR